MSGILPPSISRRRFFGSAAAAVVAACSRADPATKPETSTEGIPVAPLTSDPFLLGVASDDPIDTSVILWTRLAPDGARLETNVDVTWIVADDPGLDSVVATGVLRASAEFAHSVHVDVTGLQPDTWYHYGFVVGGFISTIGRTRTFPAAGTSSRRVRFGFSSCQNWEDGHYGAHRHAAADDLDVFIWLGDYIYESGRGTSRVRSHDAPEAVTLSDYRARYALYRSDRNLQAHHAAHPWLVTWDDHEVENDYAAEHSVGSGPVGEFLSRRAAAYRAWYEHMPVRIDPPSGADVVIYRDFAWGDLMRVFMLDARQYRDDQLTDGESRDLPEFGDSASVGVRTIGPTALDPDHSMLGVEQQSWLLDTMRAGDQKWNVLAQSVVMHGFDLGDQLTILDTWDGYTANRADLLEKVADTGATNVVVLSGDLHSASVGDVTTDPFDATSPVVATEFMAGAISSASSARAERLVELVRPINPQLKFFDIRNGYCVCDVSADSWTTTYRAVIDVSDPDSQVENIAQFVVVAGKPGAEPA